MEHVFHFLLGTFHCLSFNLSHDLTISLCILSDPFYLAPECFALDLTFKALVNASNSPHGPEIHDPANAKSCVWSLGIILLELCLVC